MIHRSEKIGVKRFIDEEAAPDECSVSDEDFFDALDLD
jgi:hypothetical protein